MSPSTRAWALVVLAAMCFIALLFVPPLAQDAAYHQFADQRTLWDVPHALNVLSNLPFVVVGVFGVAWLLAKKCQEGLPAWEWWTFLTLFLFVGLTGMGSMYYHARPGNDTLYWDRLPLTVVFMAFFGLVVSDRVSPRWGRWLIVPFVLCGVASVTYWHWTEEAGAGDVRFYAFVQFFPLLVLPLLLVFFPARHYPTAQIGAILAWYALAKLLELLDKEIYSTSAMVSGHTLKHLAAGMGAFWLWVLLRRRKPAIAHAQT